MRSLRSSIFIVALIGTAATVPAFAQSSAAEATQSTYPACAAKPSQSDTDAAHGAYMAGKGSFDEADYKTAINYFKDAYRRDCTKHELLEIIARGYELQGNRPEAVHALETYLERVPTAPDADVQKRHIANLKREIADQAAATAAPPPSAAPTASAVPTVAPLLPTTTPTSEPPPVAPQSSHSAAPWIVVGVGGAALLTGAVLFVVASGQVSTAESACPPPSHSGPNCTPAEASSGNSGRSLETVGVVVGSVGIAAVAGGLLWHFFEPSSSASTQTAKPLVAPQIGPGYAGVGLVGRF